MYNDELKEEKHVKRSKTEVAYLIDMFSCVFVVSYADADFILPMFSSILEVSAVVVTPLYVIQAMYCPCYRKYNNNN